VKLVVATRSGHKLHEIQVILGGIAELQLMDLNDLGVLPSPAEEEIEVFESFEENAIAKARYFFRVTGMPTVADDSGLVVDALGGAPGVRSKRFAPIPAEVTGEERDQENLEHLLRELGDVALVERMARYVCVAALMETDGGEGGVFRGVSEGLILGARRGRDGFGYDPVFFDPPSGKTFAELTPEEKNAVSHRGRAFRSLAMHLGRVDGV